jgi:hypothetical protein
VQITPNFNAEIPTKIMTPDRVSSRLGTLEFFDGMPSDATAATVLDHLTFLRGVGMFLSTIPDLGMSGRFHPWGTFPPVRRQRVWQDDATVKTLLGWRIAAVPDGRSARYLRRWHLPC